jgi:hypothetical protein
MTVKPSAVGPCLMLHTGSAAGQADINEPNLGMSPVKLAVSKGLRYSIGPHLRTLLAPAVPHRMDQDSLA